MYCVIPLDYTNPQLLLQPCTTLPQRFSTISSAHPVLRFHQASTLLTRRDTSALLPRLRSLPDSPLPLPPSTAPLSAGRYF